MTTTQQARPRPTAEQAAMRDVLRELDTAQIATMFSFMQWFEPDTFEAALAYVTRPEAVR